MAHADVAELSPTRSGSPLDDVTVTPLSGPLGAEVRGLVWDAEPNPAFVKRMIQAWRQHYLLVFRGQASPTHDQLDRFCSQFGKLVSGTFDGMFHYGTFTDKDSDQVHRKSNFNYVVNTDDGQTELFWHNDHFQRPQIKIMSVLEALEYEAGSPPTQFRNMYMAYEMLPHALRGELEYKMSVNLDPRKMDLEKWPRLADSMHPIFQPHPHSGRRTLYVNEFTRRIAGMDLDQSDAMLQRLLAHAEEHAPVYTHHWQVGEICMWDNVGLQHRRDAMQPGLRRVLRQYDGLAE
jgi:taurine dioxygenase